MYINFYFLQKKINVHLLTIFQHRFVRLYSVMLYNSSESLVVQSCLTLCDPMDRLLCPWNSPGKSTGVGSLSFLQRIFPDPGIESESPTLQVDSLLSEPPGKPV